ncbi:unnamed protein product [Ilex paraguariensis]|uniref:Leucine-rich repeat-containing N-terminal plant-type domain-containing protein n=1 Tax=Ilex paraguariensis TaxID=185542 RepID=A0ABC8TBG3_9AQUA
MGSRIQVWLLIVFTQILFIAAQTNSDDLAALHAIKSSWQNLPPSWKGSDPCGSSWDGIACTNSHVTSIKLAGVLVSGSQFGDIASFTNLQFLDLSNNIGLKGTLPPSIGNLKNLTTLFFGPIPDSIGSLQLLVFLALNSNSFSGPIPPSIGNLLNLSWLDLSDNQLNGTIPVSSGPTPGLDMLIKAKHFVFDNNQLTGNIPRTLGLVQTLEMVRLDWNSLNGSVPLNLNNLTSVSELYLSNNKLTGPLPNLTGMNFLTYV